MEGPWPFEDHRNTAVFTTHYVVEHGRPIVRVVRDEEDGAWQVHAALATGAEPRVVALDEIAEMDSTFFELADLPRGWTAMRDGPHSPWQRTPNSA